MKKKMQPVRSKSHAKAVEEFRLWMENTKERLDDQKSGRALCPRYKYERRSNA